MSASLSSEDLIQLQKAKQLLENPGLAAKMSNAIGSPIEHGLKLLPQSWNSGINDVTQKALLKASDAAIYTMKGTSVSLASNRMHKLGVALTGGMGGFFGIAGIAVELPISTTIMLRSIADIARAEGESLDILDTKLACLEVFALGGRSKYDDGAESGYYAVRAALAKSVLDASEFLAKKAITDQGSPILVKFTAEIAKRFGIQVTEKAVAQAVPAIGAAGGAIINTIFIGHYQDMATGHFIIRRLERSYGKEKIEEEYSKLIS
ncbi:EcsC family protein [Vibrio casei]|uniref:EcsC family protein n=1 Tax=Vibrio casei TaxID=673372 RepID=A0A368LMS8_9VIBR|nr:EcsC family protein [Vibrio casei]RCS73209.1 EcsC family protein [Vibrio casei]SJN18805.1 Staphylolytic protease preproenzyme LasA [Vibrio casei]